MKRRIPSRRRWYIADYWADLPLRELAESREITPAQREHDAKLSKSEGKK